MPKYVAPRGEARDFNCPHCGVYTEQYWYFCGAINQSVPSSNTSNLVAAILEARNKSIPDPVTLVIQFFLSRCHHCGQYAVWTRSNNLPPDNQSKLVYPKLSDVPLPSEDIPNDVKEVYLEARTIVADSPRGAAALLRLALQMLMPHLGQTSGNINNDIGALVKLYQLDELQQALDTVRVIGNNAVHPGTIDIKDDMETATTLFSLIDFIVGVTLTRKRQISALYNKLTPGQIDQIKNRDGKP